MVSSALVSIVTPSFNQARFIEETLRSVELQRYRPLHQIVIDGGSRDATVDILKRWETVDHGPGYTFEWVSEPDRGHANALNKGFDRVQGEFVGWLNSDDVYFDRSVVGLAVDAFQTHSDIDLVHGEVALISEDSGLQMILCYPKFDYERALRGYMVSQPTVFLRRSLVDRFRLNSAAAPAIDFDYWLQIGREHTTAPESHGRAEQPWRRSASRCALTTAVKKGQAGSLRFETAFGCDSCGSLLYSNWSRC